MNKEYLDAFDRITLHTEYDNDSPYDSLNFEDDCKLVDNALNRLEAIDNANPSEALKELDFIGKNCYVEAGNVEEDCILYAKDYIGYETIKQALLKAQKEHKALEILKKTIDFDLVEIGRRKVCIYSDNDDNDVVKMISEEEFNALEEVL